MVKYFSTRGDKNVSSASEAILKGLADDGGLFFPDHIPVLEKSLRQLSELSYQELAYEVMKPYLSDYTEAELKDCIEKAYDDKFDTEQIAPLTYADGAYYLELFHGATLAFKDMALSILPHLMICAARKNHLESEIVILTATSGDTGKAALAGFADVKGTKILVFYPKNGVSPIQEMQMLTQRGANTCVVGIRGNFDDAQDGVKKIFGDRRFSELMAKGGYQFSSANSINIGRLVPQIVYYVYAYAQLLKAGKLYEGEKINFVVPTGNFGNILAGFLAKQMGLPVHKLICASNENRVLFDFFQTGVYDKNRKFVLTISPSMDILVSSNLERLLYLAAGRDTGKCRALMQQLASSGRYEITPDMREKLQDFYAGYANVAQTAKRIRSLYENCGYVTDPHTAVAGSVYQKYKAQTGDQTKTVIVSTASPYKFTRSVMEAIGAGSGADDLSLADSLSALMGVKVPAAVSSLKDAPILHERVCEKDGMEEEVKRFLKLSDESI